MSGPSHNIILTHHHLRTNATATLILCLYILIVLTCASMCAVRSESGWYKLLLPDGDIVSVYVTCVNHDICSFIMSYWEGKYYMIVILFNNCSHLIPHQSVLPETCSHYCCHHRWWYCMCSYHTNWHTEWWQPWLMLYCDLGQNQFNQSSPISGISSLQLSCVFSTLLIPHNSICDDVRSDVISDATISLTVIEYSKGTENNVIYLKMQLTYCLHLGLKACL